MLGIHEAARGKAQGRRVAASAWAFASEERPNDKKALDWRPRQRCRNAPEMNVVDYSLLASQVALIQWMSCNFGLWRVATCVLASGLASGLEPEVSGEAARGSAGLGSLDVGYNHQRGVPGLKSLSNVSNVCSHFSKHQSECMCMHLCYVRRSRQYFALLTHVTITGLSPHFTTSYEPL